MVVAQRILVILGHPSSESFCAALAGAYAEGALQAGHEVRTLALGELEFEPIRRTGYTTASPPPLEPALVQAQEALTWAQQIVLVYPTWWGAPPALVKGFFDRVLTPGFAFKYRTGSPLWDKLLAGRSAQLVVTMDTPPWFYRLFYRASGVRQLRQHIFEFCGIRPVRALLLGPIRGSSDARRASWLARVAALARR